MSPLTLVDDRPPVIVVTENDGDDIFRHEAELTLFLRMRTKAMPNH